MTNDECRMMNDGLGESLPLGSLRRARSHPSSSFCIHHSSFIIRDSCRRAFTLIEILVVVTILAILASAVVLTFSGKTDQARVARAKSDIATFETAIETFKLEMRRYPTEDEGLRALVEKPDSEDANRWTHPYVKRLEKDPWGNPYVYVCPGNHNADSFDIISYGADGREGGQGEFDKDIGNWTEEEKSE
jgi:general secretion pathway protein G